MLGRSVRVAREGGMQPARRSTAERCVDSAGRRAKARCLGCLGDRHHALVLHLAPLPPSRLTSFPPEPRPSRRRHPALVLHLAAPALILLVAAAPPSSSTSAPPLPSSSSLPPPQLWSSFSSSPPRPCPLPRHPLASCSPCHCGGGTGRAGCLGRGSRPSTPSSPPLHHASLR